MNANIEVSLIGSISFALCVDSWSGGAASCDTDHIRSVRISLICVCTHMYDRSSGPTTLELKIYVLCMGFEIVLYIWNHP